MSHTDFEIRTYIIKLSNISSPEPHIYIKEYCILYILSKLNILIKKKNLPPIYFFEN